MKFLKRDSDYAIRAIIYIAKSKHEIVSSKELFEELNIPLLFLRKILQILQKEKVLKSIKGNKGGFLLAKPVRKIFIADIINIFQGKISFTDCFLKGEICSEIKKCPLRKKMQSIEKMVVSEINQISIASLI